MTTTPRVNLIVLNKGADLFHWGEKVVLSWGNSSAKDLPSILSAVGADAITVEYHTVSDPKIQVRDHTKYSKRLANLGDVWAISSWTNKVVDGHVFDTVMQCTITRVNPEA